MFFRTLIGGCMARVKKSADQKATRQAAEQVVDLFLELIMSSDEDAGWRGGSVLGMIVDFQGDLPRSSVKKNVDRVWQQCSLLNDWTASHKSAYTVMQRLTDKQREALCMDRAYRGRTRVAIDPFNPEQPVELYWDDDQCANVLGCSKNAFKCRISKAYERLENEFSKSAVQG